jgi:hypothetical protein
MIKRDKRATCGDPYSGSNPYRRLVRFDLASPMNLGISPNVHGALRTHEDMRVFIYPYTITDLDRPTVCRLIDLRALVDIDVRPQVDPRTPYGRARIYPASWIECGKDNSFQGRRGAEKSKACGNSTTIRNPCHTHPKSWPLPTQFQHRFSNERRLSSMSFASLRNPCP